MTSPDAHVLCSLPEAVRLPTHVPGLDVVLGGGLLTGDAYLIVGEPGTGKTTLGNQLAFAHAAAGGRAVVATLLTESHDRILTHLRGFAFADAALLGERVRYLGFLGVLEDGGTDEVLTALRQAVRDHAATLLVIDGAASALAGFDGGRFVHQLQARSALHGCTTVMLAGAAEAAAALGHVDGVIELTNRSTEDRDVRWLRAPKLRGSASLGGRHAFTIGAAGVTVFPRLEAVAATHELRRLEPETRAAFGVEGLDAMLSGGVPHGSSTLLLGTPGAGKTVLGLHFLAEGARRGEPGLIAAFHETPADLAGTADGAGMVLGAHLASGLVRVLWRRPLECSPDEWAHQLLAAVEEHRPRRVVVDAFTDLAALFAASGRPSQFILALGNGLRNRGATSIFILEHDAFVGPELAAPIPHVSAAMDNGILLRSVELRSSMRRLVSILKLRQSPFDPALREFAIGPGGIVIGQPLAAVGLLTGSAVPEREAR